jgi:hypothetical protein
MANRNLVKPRRNLALDKTTIEVISTPTEKEIVAACSPDPTTSANEPLALD